jgi:hypothetical protein
MIRLCLLSASFDLISMEFSTFMKYSVIVSVLQSHWAVKVLLEALRMLKEDIRMPKRP